MIRKPSFADSCPSFCGKLHPDTRHKLVSVVNRPTPGTWDKAHCVIIPGPLCMTLWQAVIAVNPAFPKQGPVSDHNGRCVSGWRQIPDKITLYRAIRFAISPRPDNPWRAEILYRTPVWRIGKHDWRMVVYIEPRHGNCTGFEWRKAPDEKWSRDVDWPRYNGDHRDGGMPRTLRKLYEAHRAEITAALAKAA